LFDPEEIRFDPEEVLLFDPDGWDFFRVFFVFDDFFCIFVLSDLLFFSEMCFFYGDPEGACLIQMGPG